MADLNRIQASWQSWPGAPGVSTHYSEGSALDNDTAAIRAFYNSLVALIPSGLTIQVQGVGDTFDIATGKITGGWAATSTPAVVTGSGLAAYAGNAGAVVHWFTVLVINGHRVRGRTFLVPLVSTAFDTAGSISTAALSTIRGAAAGLISGMSGSMRMWHRPNAAGAGGSAPVLTSTVPDLAVTLRSRRV